MRGTLLARSSAVVDGASLVVAALLLGNGKAGMNAVALLFYFSPIQVYYDYDYDDYDYDYDYDYACYYDYYDYAYD